MISSPFSSAEGEISETGPVQLVIYKKRVMISSHSLDVPLFKNELFFLPQSIKICLIYFYKYVYAKKCM